jgi:hypothetical protein
MPSNLTRILTDVENQLGWVPTGKNIHHARALAHHIVTQAMKRQGISEDDLELTVAYCRRKRLPIDSPLQLLPLVTKAREAAPDIIKPHNLDVETTAAITWEHSHLDPDSLYWIGRLTRSVGPARADTLTEWHQAGRGENT